jgi:3'-5' exoribonuclease
MPEMTKKTFIADLKTGDRFDDLFRVQAMREALTKAGKPYIALTVADKTGELGGNIWDDVDALRGICRVGNFVKIRGRVEEYNQKPQLRLEAIEAAAENEISLADFLVVSPRGRDEMAVELHDVVASVKNPHLKKLLKHFYGSQGEASEKILDAPAAKGFHHAYVGGLLEHILSMAKIADGLAGHFPGVDRDLLVAAALLHDLGKLEELHSPGGVTDYTDAGRLLGHISITSAMVGSAARRQKDFPEELLLHLQHCILSHHGRLEFGSPVLPMTVEAFLLSAIDDLDAKMNMFERLRREKKDEGMGWTEYQRALERYLYIEKFPSADGHENKSEGESGQNVPVPPPRQGMLF